MCDLIQLVLSLSLTLLELSFVQYFDNYLVVTHVLESVLQFILARKLSRFHVREDALCLQHLIQVRLSLLTEVYNLAGIAGEFELFLLPRESDDGDVGELLLADRLLHNDKISVNNNRNNYFST